MLITAGPGTGKTFTLVQRSLYLIQEKGIKPEEILVATFTEKAAKELITRISNTLLKKGILLNLNEMYIGTFHSICLRFIKENLEYSNIKKITVPWMTLTRNIPSCEKCVFSKK